MGNQNLSEIERRLLSQDAQHDEAIRELKETLADIKIAFNTNAQRTQELIDLYKSMKAFGSVLKLVERFAVWLAKVSAAIAIFWLAFKYGVTEILKDVFKP